MKKLLLIFVVFGFAYDANAINLREAIQTDAVKAIQDLYDLERATEISCSSQEKAKQQLFINSVQKKINKVNASPIFLQELQKEYLHAIKELEDNHQALDKKREDLALQINALGNELSEKFPNKEFQEMPQDDQGIRQIIVDAQTMQQIEIAQQQIAEKICTYTNREFYAPYLQDQRKHMLRNASPMERKKAIFREKMKRE